MLTATTVRPLLRTTTPALRLLANSQASRRGVATKKEDVVKHLEKHGLFKDVLSKFDPLCQLNARFLSSGEEAKFGNEITPVHAQGQPSIELLPFPGEDKLPDSVAGKKGYVVMTDPDAPSHDNPEWSEFCHWITSVTAPEASDKKNEIVHNKESKQIMEYAGPAPPEKTGKHRYLLVMLQGDETNVEAPSDRKNWGTGKQRTGVKQWAEKYGLKPIAANFFLAEHSTEENKDSGDVHDDKKGLGVGTGAGYGSA